MTPNDTDNQGAACREWRAWRAGDGGEPPPQALHDHAARCAACRRLDATYGAAVGTFVSATRDRAPAPPPFDAIRRAVPAPGRPASAEPGAGPASLTAALRPASRIPASRPAWQWLAAAAFVGAAAAAVVTALVSSLSRDRPNGEVALPSPAAAIPAPEPAPVPALPPAPRLSTAPAKPAEAPIPAPVAIPVPPTAGTPAPEDLPEPLRDARLAIAAGDPDAAIQALKAVVSAPGPERGRALAVVGDAHKAAGRVADADAAWTAATEAGYSPPGLVADMARARAKIGRSSGAAAAWRLYSERYPAGPDLPEALLAVADAEDADGREQAALAGWKDVATRFAPSPQAAIAFRKAGRRMLRHGTPDIAAAWFETGIASTNRRLAEEAVVGLIVTRVAQGRRADAESLARDHAARFPDGERSQEVREALGASRPAP